MSIATQKAACKDIPLLVEMMQEFYAESGYPLDQQWATDSFATLLGDKSYGGTWIVFCDGEPAGYGVLTVRFSMEYGGLEGAIDDLFVRPGYRRRGVGRAVLKELFDECRRRKVLAVYVEVAPDNTAAKVLYNSFGLHRREDERQVLMTRLKDTVSNV